MNLISFIGQTFCILHITSCSNPTNHVVRTPVLSTSPEDVIEDQQVINETFSKYGLSQDYKSLDLPGPELKANNDKYSVSNKLQTGNNTTSYTFKIRTITEHFSYNARYEETKINKTGNQEFVITKGQFAEHFQRKSGGHYIRTIGYFLDENGYRQFLIDLSMAKTTTTEVEIPLLGGGPPVVGAPSTSKVTISSTALGSLMGGNSLG